MGIPSPLIRSWGIYDLFRYAGISPIGVVITSGTTPSQDGQILSVPKLSLISRLQAILHQGQLKIHNDIPDAPALVRELQDFRVEYTSVGNLTFNARFGRHDDLVLVLAIACWIAHGGAISNSGIFELYKRNAAALSGLPAPDRQVIGVDLGQSRDPTAICVVRRAEPIAGIAPLEPGPVRVAAA